MGQNIILTGMVLQSTPIGEYDKRITILTKERGRITAFAKGARRPGNQLLAATNPFSFGEFEMYQGRSSYNVARASVSNYFRELALDYDTACYGFYFLEIADYFAMENNNEKNLLGLLYQTMRALESPALPNRLIRVIYELKVLVLNGTYPNVFCCSECGVEENLVCFDMAKAGMLCADCAKTGKGMTISASTLYALQFIITAPIEKLYTFTLSDQVLQETERIERTFFHTYVDHTFKAECFLV